MIWAALLSFAGALALGPLVIPWLKRLKFGQTIYELGPESHQRKSGTPTMGGAIIALPMIVMSIILAYPATRWNFMLIALVSTIGFGAIGTVDDWIKVKLKRSQGLTPMQKIVPQVCLALVLSVWAYLNPLIGGGWLVPFGGGELSLGWLYVPVMTFVIVGTVNSANLLDGLDGLLTSASAVGYAAFALIALMMAAGVTGFTPPIGSDPTLFRENLLNIALFAGAYTGACLGYLRYNSHPAQVFMGDIGSFAIGGGVAAIALVLRLPLLLPLVAIGMLLSTLSDLIQFAYFRATHGKRVFRMAPLHPHFELSGVPVTRIVAVYTIVTVVACLVALLGLGIAGV